MCQNLFVQSRLDVRKDCIHQINSPSKTSFVILTAGKNKTRGERCNKSLLDVSKKSKTIDQQIRTIKRFSKDSDVVVVTGYDSKNLNEYIFSNYPDVRVVENSKYEITTSLESLRMGLNCCLKSNIYCVHGDCCFNLESLKIPDKSKPHVVLSNKKMNKKEVGVIHKDSDVVRMSYGLEKEWGEILYFPSSLFSRVREGLYSCKKYKNLFEYINILIDSKIEFKIHESKKIKITRATKK